jgi:5-formyltetrahydrofolate cyclo-ligase
VISETDQRLSALQDAKRELRRRMLERRRGLVSERAGELLIERVRALGPLEPAWPVSGFWPIGEEIDVKPLLAELDRQGHPIGLPVVIKRGAPLRFRRWRPGDRLTTTHFGLSVPPPEAPELEPRLVIVPLLAFDRLGYRLGYGGGFYDRTLAGLRERATVLAVGVAYSGQEVPAVPRGPEDQRLDWVLTEAEAIRMGAS